MALTYAILSVLADRPQTKAEIIKYFEKSVGFFWKASHQQIYAEMANLERQGWINSPDRQRYRLNAIGKQELNKWITEPCEPLSIQDDLLIKVMASGVTNLTFIRQELIRHRQLHLEKLLAYHIIQEQSFPNSQVIPAAKVFPYLTLRRGMRYEQEWIDWCQESLSLLATPTDRTTNQILSCHLN